MAISVADRRSMKAPNRTGRSELLSKRIDRSPTQVVSTSKGHVSARERPSFINNRLDLRAHLGEVIAALDRRVRHPGRHTEAAIAADAATLKREAKARLAALDREGAATVKEGTARG